VTGSVRPPVSPLRRRFIDDLRLRNYSPRTIESYVGRGAQVAQHFGRSPDTLGPDDIRVFQLHLLERKVSWSTFNQTVCALRFLFGTMLGRPEQLPLIPYGKRPKTLPSVLSPAEVVRLLEAAKPGRERVRLQTAYACGLRLGELLHPQVADIDSARMVVDIRHGKGGKQRRVPLSGVLLAGARSAACSAASTWPCSDKPLIKGSCSFPAADGDNRPNENACRKLARTVTVANGKKRGVPNPIAGVLGPAV
jgi:integrase/recombinase XerD